MTHNQGIHDDFLNADDRRLVILYFKALFSEDKLTLSAGKGQNLIDYAHLVCLTYKVLTGSKDSKDISFGNDGIIQRRREALTKNKEAPINDKFHVRIYFKDASGKTEHQNLLFAV